LRAYLPAGLLLTDLRDIPAELLLAGLELLDRLLQRSDFARDIFDQ
jgi:hypothetical protein